MNSNSVGLNDSYLVIKIVNSPKKDTSKGNQSNQTIQDLSPMVFENINPETSQASKKIKANVKTPELATAVKKQKEIVDFKEYYDRQKKMLKNNDIGSYYYAKEVAERIDANLQVLSGLKENPCKLSYYKDGKLQPDANRFFRSIRFISKALGFNKDFMDKMVCLKEYTDFMKFYFENVVVKDSEKKALTALLINAQDGIEKLRKETYGSATSPIKMDLLTESINNIKKLRESSLLKENKVRFENEIRGGLEIIKQKSFSPIQEIIYLERRIKNLIDDPLNFPNDSSFMKLRKRLSQIEEHYSLLIACLCLEIHKKEYRGEIRKYIEAFCSDICQIFENSPEESESNISDKVQIALGKLTGFNEILNEIEILKGKDVDTEIAEKREEIDQREKLLHAAFLTISGAGLMSLGYLFPVKFAIPHGDEFVRKGIDGICERLLETKRVNEEDIPGVKDALFEFKKRIENDYVSNMKELYQYILDRKKKGEEMSDGARDVLEKLGEVCDPSQNNLDEEEKVTTEATLTAPED